MCSENHSFNSKDVFAFNYKFYLRKKNVNIRHQNEQPLH